MSNFDVIYKSAKPLEGAVDALTNNTQVAHVPGYGLLLVSNEYVEGNEELEEKIEGFKSIIFGLGGMVKGLPEKESITLTLNAYRGGGRHSMVVVQMRQGDPSSLKVFVDGQSR